MLMTSHTVLVKPGRLVALLRKKGMALLSRNFHYINFNVSSTEFTSEISKWTSTRNSSRSTTVFHKFTVHFTVVDIRLNY